MAVRKPTKTDDVAEVDNGAAPVVPEVVAPKMVKLKSPTGAVTEVPEGIVDALLDSGYKK